MKTYCSIVLMILFCYCGMASAQNGIFKGIVSSGEETLEAVSVVLENENHKKWAISDKKGVFELNIPEGDYILKVNSLGFIPLNERISILAGKTVERKIVLKEDVVGMEEVVVTATKTHLNRKEAPVLVSVTNSKDLAKVKATTLIEGLVFQPGLRTEVNCQNCGFSQVRINGLDGAYSQILIDSRPIFGSLNSVYGLEQIPAGMIDRIEVIRGGGSALFGSNAIGGTINIITKNPTKNEAEAGITTAWIDGESEDIVASFNGSLVSENYMKGLSFYGINRLRQPYDANNDGFSELTRLRNLNVGAKFFNEFSTRKKLVGELNIGNEDRRGGNKFELPAHLADIAESIRTSTMGANLSYDYFTKSNQHKLSVFVSGQRTKADNYYGAYDTENNAYDLYGLNYGVTRENVWIIGGQHTTQLFVGDGTIQWTSGTEYKSDEISENRRNPNVLKVNQNQNVWGLYSQVDWRFNSKMKVLAGLRMDNVNANTLNQAVTSLNPRASFLYNITEKYIARTSYARGFRAPLFYSEDVHSELVTGEVRRVELASDLKKETSDSFTVSLEYNHSQNGKQLIVMAEGFYTSLNNPFVYTSIGKENDLDVKQKQNGDRATVQGVNFEVKYSPSTQFILQMGATVQRSKYASKQVIAEDENGVVIVESDKFLRSPDVYGNFTATYKPIDSWSINLTSVYTGKMELLHARENKLKTTRGMFDFGCNTSYDFSFSNFFDMELSLGVKNIFNAYQKDFDSGIDRDSAYIYGPALPRTFFAGLKIKL